MRLIVLIFAAVMFVSSPVIAQDKNPRGSDDKKEEKSEDSGNKMDKIKGKLSKKGKHHDDDDDSDDSMAARFVFHFWWDINKHYHYTPYPYYGQGLLNRDSSNVRSLHFETALSAFSGGSNIKAVNFDAKLKLYTLFGFGFQYNGFTEDDLLSGSDMKMYRFNGVINLLSHPYGLLELKAGLWNIADVGTGPLIGFQADIAPVYPIMLNLRADFSEINGHEIGDLAFRFGYVYKRIEFFGGYRVFDLAGETIDGPFGGATVRF